MFKNAKLEVESILKTKYVYFCSQWWHFPLQEHKKTMDVKCVRIMKSFVVHNECVDVSSSNRFCIISIQKF
jgi:hypothetical protein